MLFPVECPFPISVPGTLLLLMQLKDLLLLLEAFLALLPPIPSLDTVGHCCSVKEECVYKLFEGMDKSCLMILALVPRVQAAGRCSLEVQ